MIREKPNPQAIETSTGSASGPVVVGFDGSPESRDALVFGAEQADRRGVALRIVSAFTIVVSDVGLAVGGQWNADLVDAIHTAAEREAQQAADAVRADHPDVPVHTVVVPGPAAGVVLDNSADATMVVVGTRGRGRFMGMLGGTSRQIATHCTAPTVVVRQPRPTGSAVVVGIDGSPDSTRALAFAFDYASRQGLRLRAVHTWDVPPIGAITGVPSPEPPELVREMADNEARAALEQLAGFSDRYPDVLVERTIERGSPVKQLVEQSADAALLVVGSRGRGGFLGLILGSVSHGVLHHAQCNVAVVKARL